MKARIFLISVLTAVIALTGCNGKGDSSDDIKAVTASPENKSSDVFNPDYSEPDDSSAETEETRDPDETGEVVIVTKKRTSHKGDSSSEDEEDSSREDTPTSTESASSRRETQTSPQATFPSPTPPSPTGTMPVVTVPIPTQTARPTQTAKPTQSVTKSTTKQTTKQVTKSPTQTVSPSVIHTMKMSEYIVFLNAGQSHKLNAVYEPSTMKVNIVWTSNRTDIATVDQSGNVRAVGAGSAIITVKDTLSGLTASCMIRVG